MRRKNKYIFLKNIISLSLFFIFFYNFYNYTLKKFQNSFTRNELIVLTENIKTSIKDSRSMLDMAMKILQNDEFKKTFNCLRNNDIEYSGPIIIDRKFILEGINKIDILPFCGDKIRILTRNIKTLNDTDNMQYFYQDVIFGDDLYAKIPIKFINNIIYNLKVGEMMQFIIPNKKNNIHSHLKTIIHEVGIDSIDNVNENNIPFVINYYNQVEDLKNKSSLKFLLTNTKNYNHMLNNIFCNSKIKINYKIYNINNDLLYETKQSVLLNVGNLSMPYTVELLLLRMNVGESAKILVTKNSTYKNLKNHVSLVYPIILFELNELLIFDIMIEMM